MAKQETKILERTYNVPLRKEYLKAPRYLRAKKAVKALKEFLIKHMKSDNVRLEKEVNELVWKKGIKNPPHHVKVVARKDERGVVSVELFGAKKKEAKVKEKKIKKEAPVKEEQKVA